MGWVLFFSTAGLLVGGACVEDAYNHYLEHHDGGAQNGGADSGPPGADAAVDAGSTSDGGATDAGSSDAGSAADAGTVQDGGADAGCTTPQTFYRDQDGDGWGDSALSVNACGAPTGYVVDAGDCCDMDSSAFPGQAGWFTSPDGCGNYDYDCSGVEELQYATVACSVTGRCPTLNEMCNTLSDAGWDGTVPGCGAIGNFVTSCGPTLDQNCSCACYVCNPSTVSQAQACH